MSSDNPLLSWSLKAQARRLAAFAAEIGLGRPGAIPETMSFRDWCVEMGRRGLKVDGKPFTLENRPALIPVYDKIPTTRAEGRGRIIVIQKAAQLGLTVWETLADLYLALKFEPLVIGMFLPDQATAAYKSEHRFLRIVRTIPEIHQRMTSRVQDGTVLRIGEGNVLTRVIGESGFLFLWTSGRVSTESRPMDMISLDEVQEMTLEQIDKVRERLSASDFRMMLMLSTANLPDADINYWYKQGTQEVWHSLCLRCGALSDLSDPYRNFPRSIGYNSGQIAGAPINEYVWLCGDCGGWIADPQQGRYIATVPGAAIESMLLPQTISPTITPRDLIGDWNRAVTGGQKKSFYNRKLARPYIDSSQLPVSLEDCLACVEEGRRLGVVWKTAARDTVAGIDQMGGFNCVIIKERLGDGRQAVVHVEAVFDNDPFERCSDLMAQYGVAVCVLEQLPNVNDARRFANRHRGRVFLAGYADLRDDMMLWGDELSRSDRRTSAEDRTRYTVTLNQYKAMQTALFRLRNRACLFADPASLEQDVIERGERRRIAILRDWVFLHFTRVALVVEDDPQTRRARAKVVKTGGIDPHFAYANMLCDIAWARLTGTAGFMMPGAPEAGGPGTPKPAAEAMPGLPVQLAQLIDSLPAGVCGRCSAFQGGRCTERGFMVAVRAPGCAMFVASDNS
ncbi:MAG: phage terminase large subunit family protein [Azospirillaceae bacterium]|nr:phage terminase large subunit family protein [Azospirillaceae bacterium]